MKFTATNGIEISGNINQLKEWASEIAELAGGQASDLSKHLQDTIFAIESSYQSYHGLDENNWDIVHF